MRLFRNEKGSALVYVLFIFVVLGVLIPVILSTSSQATLHHVTDRNERIATTLANSSIETFIAYLEQVPEQGDRVTYFSNYPGIIESKTYTLPQGIPVEYSFTSPTATTVEAKVIVGSGASKREKAVQYSFQVQNGSGGGSARTSVPEDPNQVIYGNTAALKNTDVTINKNDVQSKITTILNAESKRITDYSKSYIDSAPGCVNSSDIDNAIANGSANPVLVINVCNDVELDSGSKTWGSSTKPVVMIFNSLSFKNGYTLNVYGDLIVKDTFSVQNHSTVQINRSPSSNLKNGNLIVLEYLDVKNGLFLNSSDNPLRNFFAKSADFSNYSKVYADNFIVSGHVEIKNGGIYDVNMDIIAGSMDVQNHSTITAVNGDILVKDDLTINNGGTYTSGGLIAVGNSLDIGNHLTVDTGGGTTQINGSGSGGSPTTPAPWKPVRN
jgi:hypothetical protein